MMRTATIKHIMSIFKISMQPLVYSVIVLVLSATLVTGRSANETSSVPSDFSFVMDVRTPEVGSANHINIKIDAKGKGQFEVYDSGGEIRYDLNDVVIYEADQIMRDGKFKLSKTELKQLWGAINENKFFELAENYQMAIGHSYAFIMIEADGRKHMVDNIGVEVPEIRALVEATDALMPEGLDLDYGEGYIFQK
jgi:hypothetical protein